MTSARDTEQLQHQLRQKQKEIRRLKFGFAMIMSVNLILLGTFIILNSLQDYTF